MVASNNLRPKRKATNAHIFRYLQTRNPTKLEEDDLKRALEASLEECPDFWPKDSASCSSASEQSNGTCATASTSGSSVGGGGGGREGRAKNSKRRNRANKTNNRRRSKSMQHNHLKHHHNHQSHMHNPYHHLINHQNNSHSNTLTANSNCCCPMSNVHNRYKPVAKKNIYNEADFFHDGIMEYIEYQLEKTWAKSDPTKN